MLAFQPEEPRGAHLIKTGSGRVDKKTGKSLGPRLVKIETLAPVKFEIVA